MFAAGLVLAWGLMVAIFALAQRSLMYHPDRTRPTPAVFGAPTMAVATAKTADGLKLDGWFVPPGEEQDRPVILVFHGNAGHIGGRVPLANAFAARGFGVLLAEYRGFGGNPGGPSEEGLYKDGEAWLAWLTAQGYTENRIVVYGESLGSGIATEMASRHPDLKATILQSGFTSMASLGKLHYPYLPVEPLIYDRYDNEKKIAAIATPLLLLHGARDTLVPPSHSQTLYGAARSEKKHVLFEEAAHSDLHPERIAAETALFLDSLSARPAPPAP